jgi:16S rRNA (cytosine1402-N4)-methyltransferase
MVDEVIALLAPKPDAHMVDATTGHGGHAEAILERLGPDGLLVGLDRDPEMLAVAEERLSRFGARVRLYHARFAFLREVVAAAGAAPVDGVLLDLGVCSAQLDRVERGMSFRIGAEPVPLDMRMDRSQGETAADLVNEMDEEDLANLIYEFGEDRASRKIARAIVSARRQHRIATTGELATLVRRASGRPSWKPGIDSATRTFQALRIYVNRELDQLSETLRALAGCLAPDGRLAVIAFHSLEDREVKHTFRALGTEGFEVLARKPVRPSDAEAARNPRSRSARLRGLRRREAA